MKKFLSIALFSFLALMLVGCGKETTTVKPTLAPTTTTVKPTTTTVQPTTTTVKPTTTTVLPTTTTVKNDLSNTTPSSYKYEDGRVNAYDSEGTTVLGYITPEVKGIGELNAMEANATVPYIVKGYFTESKMDIYGNGYIVDLDGNIIQEYGTAPLNSAIHYRVVEGSIQFDVYNKTDGTTDYQNPKAFITSAQDAAEKTYLINEGDYVELLVVFLIFNGTKELKSEIITVDAEKNLAKLDKKYTPVITKDDNITKVTLDKETYSYGETATATIEYATDFGLDTVTLVPASGKSALIKANADGTVSFVVGIKSELKLTSVSTKVETKSISLSSVDFKSTYADSKTEVASESQTFISYKDLMTSGYIQFSNIKTDGSRGYGYIRSTVSLESAMTSIEVNRGTGKSGAMSLAIYASNTEITDISTLTKVGEIVFAKQDAFAAETQTYTFTEDYTFFYIVQSSGTGYYDSIVINRK